jgi:hypothetical protein
MRQGFKLEGCGMCHLVQTNAHLVYFSEILLLLLLYDSNSATFTFELISIFRSNLIAGN